MEVKPPDGPPERFIPEWRGGAPAQGGGPDKAVLAELAQFNVGDRVKVRWKYDDRKRLVRLEAAK